MASESRKSDASTSSHSSSSSSSEQHEVDMKDVEMAPLTPKKTGDGDDGFECTVDTPGGLEGLLIKLKRNGQVLNACSFYSFCSVSMVLVNKSLASR